MERSPNHTTGVPAIGYRRTLAWICALSAALSLGALGAALLTRSPMLILAGLLGGAQSLLLLAALRLGSPAAPARAAEWADQLAQETAARQRAEGGLREAERTLRLLADNTADTIFMFDMDRRLQYISSAFEQLTEYTVAELRERGFINYLHPDDEERMKALLEGVYAGQPFDAEFRIVTRSGLVKWCLSSWKPLFNNHGLQIGVQGREIDISNRKLVEEDLRASEASNRAILASIPDTIMRVDHAGLILDYKPSRDTTSLYAGACIGQHITKVLPLTLAVELLASFQAPPTDDTPHRLEYSVPLRLGEHLLATELITPNMLDIALDHQSQARAEARYEPLGAILVSEGALSPDGLEAALQAQRQECAIRHFEARVAASGEAAFVVMIRDITDRRQAEEQARQELAERKRTELELRESNERFQQITDHIPEVFWMYDRVAERFVYVSPAYETIWRRPRTDVYEPGFSFLDAIHPEDRSDVQHILAQQARGQVTKNEFRIVRPDGSIRWILDHSTPLLGEDGQVQRITGVSADITERKDAEEALHESQHLLLSIAQATPDLIYVWNAIERKDVFTNRATAVMLGYADDAIDRLGDDPLRSLMHPDDQTRLDLIRANYHKLAEGEIFENEYRLRDAGGAWRWFYSRDLVFSRTPDGKPMLMIGTSQDITARKQSEQALSEAYHQLELLNNDLQRSRDLLRMLFDKLKDGLLLLDGDGRVLTLNQSLAGLLGGADGGAPGRLWIDVCIDSGSFAAIGPWVLQTLRDGRARQRRERIALPDDGLRVIDFEVFPICNAEGQAEQLVVHTVDVTERLQIEAQMIEQERFAASGRLAATVAHEVNTPLQAVESCLHMVERASGARRSEYLQLARDEVIRVGQIVRQLLDVFRTSQNVRSPIDINALLGRVLLLTGSTLAKQGIYAQTALADDLPPVWGHGDELTQVLLNLVVNASHAMPHGGTLRLRTAHGPPLPNSATSVLIEVADNGAGMDDALQTRIFEPFFSTKPTGSGLGLAISQKIVTQHQGSLSVRSQPGAGSTFSVILPVGEEAHTGT